MTARSQVGHNTSGPASERPITVAHVITGLDVGGAERMLHNLVRSSNQARYKHIVISLLEAGPVGDDIIALGIPVHSLRMRAGLPDPRALLRLYRLLRRTRPHVVQTWMYHANLLGLLAGKMAGAPVIWNIRDAFHPDSGGSATAIARLCAPIANLPVAVVTNSDTARTRHTQLGYRPKEWLVIPNGFDINRFAPDDDARRAVRRELGLPPNAILIGLVGRFHPIKGHQTFLEAAAMLNRHWPDIHFLLVGRDVCLDNAELRGALLAAGLSNHVTLLGEREDIPRLTAALDIATNASYSESFSNVVGEAMASAIPCVVTDVGDMARVVENTGRVVPAGDAQAMAAAWSDLLALDARERLELGNNARARIKALYSLESIVRQYESLYERVARV